MYCKQRPFAAQRVAILTIALVTSGAALADDNSMSRLTGDSYAFFNDLDYRAGRFNVARALQAAPQVPLASMPKKDVEQAEPRILLADRAPGIALPSPFRDNTGA